MHSTWDPRDKYFLENLCEVIHSLVYKKLSLCSVCTAGKGGCSFKDKRGCRFRYNLCYNNCAVGGPEKMFPEVFQLRLEANSILLCSLEFRNLCSHHGNECHWTIFKGQRHSKPLNTILKYKYLRMHSLIFLKRFNRTENRVEFVTESLENEIICVISLWLPLKTLDVFGISKLSVGSESEHTWLFVSFVSMWSRERLAACSGYTPPSAQWRLGQSPTPPALTRMERVQKMNACTCYINSC